ncbi:tetratricopeptide repeat protein [Thermodesulfovibrionales bacterium]|nr:tetratricopeptide repeat protein [Thermodesulfovibrionales bacterium]
MQNTKYRLKGILLLFAIFILPFSVSGCVTVSPEFEALRSNVAHLQVEFINQERKIAEIKAVLSEISSSVAELKEHSRAAGDDGLLLISRQISDLSRELMVLKDRVEENRHFMEMTTREFRADGELHLSKIASLEEDLKELWMKTNDGQKIAQVGDNFIAADEVIPADAEHLVIADANADAERLYINAQVSLTKGEYAEARQKFIELIQNSPDHDLVPFSHFWIGEAYYAEGRYKDAILAYEYFLREYHGHEKGRVARLKQAYAFIGIGDKRVGRIILDRLIEEYPDSHEAGLARDKIAEIGP